MECRVNRLTLCITFLFLIEALKHSINNFENKQKELPMLWKNNNYANTRKQTNKLMNALRSH